MKRSGVAAPVGSYKPGNVKAEEPHGADEDAYAWLRQLLGTAGRRSDKSPFVLKAAELLATEMGYGLSVDLLLTFLRQLQLIVVERVHIAEAAQKERHLERDLQKAAQEVRIPAKRGTLLLAPELPLPGQNGEHGDEEMPQAAAEAAEEGADAASNLPKSRPMSIKRPSRPAAAAAAPPQAGSSAAADSEAGTGKPAASMPRPKITTPKPKLAGPKPPSTQPPKAAFGATSDVSDAADAAAPPKKVYGEGAPKARPTLPGQAGNKAIDRPAVPPPAKRAPVPKAPAANAEGGHKPAPPVSKHAVPSDPGTSSAKPLLVPMAKTPSAQLLPSAAAMADMLAPVSKPPPPPAPSQKPTVRGVKRSPSADEAEPTPGSSKRHLAAAVAPSAEAGSDQEAAQRPKTPGKIVKVPAAKRPPLGLRKAPPLPSHADTGDLGEAGGSSSSTAFPRDPSPPAPASSPEADDERPLRRESSAGRLSTPEDLERAERYHALISELSTSPILSGNGVAAQLDLQRFRSIVTELLDGVARRPIDWLQVWAAMQLPQEERSLAVGMMLEVAVERLQANVAGLNEVPAVVFELVKSHRVKVKHVEDGLGHLAGQLKGEKDLETLLLGLAQEFSGDDLKVSSLQSWRIARQVYAACLVSLYPRPQSSGWGWSRVGWSFHTWLTVVSKCIERLERRDAFGCLAAILMLLQKQAQQPLMELLASGSGDGAAIALGDRAQKLRHKLVAYAALGGDEIEQERSIVDLLLQLGLDLTLG
eukprot:TRINITY_DN90386_c0_g1_i1.p1 TRINITY_DN90386_c0_g1~~TRINITY_DN90386_c0_g1_i1.p1  ORF type:complete len:759 (+),score=222.98 TRINITY_DN90386_c0_g1_i1:89-2365(+)